MLGKLPSILIVLTPVLLQGAPKIVSVSVLNDHGQSVYVTFDQPLPNPSDVKSGAHWTIYSSTKTGLRKHLVSGVDMSTFDTERTIRLELRSPIPNGAVLDVTYIGKGEIVHVPKDIISFGPLPSPSEPVTGAKNKNDADIYFKGSYTAVVAGDPVYDIDAFAGYMHALQVGPRKTYLGRVGFYGQMRTKKSSKADPNSFLTYLVYQRHIGSGTSWIGPFSLPYFNYRFAGWEFDRNGKQLNFVTSPVLTVPVRLSGKLSGALEPGVSFPHMTFQMGTEFVDVRKSALAPAGKWHSRGLLGTTFSTGYAPEKNLFDSVQLTSSYQVRLPSSPEIFYDDRFAPVDPVTRKVGATPPMLGTQARHSLDTKLSYMFVKWAGVSFEHTYGSQPPLFVRNGHAFEFGVTFTLKQTSYGRYSILRP